MCHSAFVSSVQIGVLFLNHIINFRLSAFCSNACQNGGTCTAPDTCACDVGWTGMQCDTGEMKLLLSF